MEHRCSTKDGSRTAAYGEPPTDMMEPTSSARSVTIPLPRRGCCTTDIDASSPSMHDINTCGGPFHTDGLLSNLDVTPKLCTVETAQLPGWVYRLYLCNRNASSTAALR